MLLKLTTCYSRILYLMSHGEHYGKAVNAIKIGRPCFEHEGVAGYVETTVEIDIKDLLTFSKLWESWFSIPDLERNKWYMLAKGGACG